MEDNNYSKDSDMKEKISKGVDKAGSVVKGTGRTVQAAGTTVQVAGKATQVAGKATKVAGTGTKYAGKGVSAAGEGIAEAGTALSSTGLGSIIGVPLTAVGKVTSGLGKATEAVGTAGEKVGDTVDKAGKTVDNAGKNIKNTGKNIVNQGNSMKSFSNELNAEGDFSVSGVLKKTNNIVALFSVIGLFLLVILFIVVFIAPLMALGIIDIDGIVGSDGLGYSSNTYLKSIDDDCKSIIVDGIGAVELEDYVAGVITGEAILSEDIEALKAQAIAARTYAIVRSNFCKKSLKNSSSDQNYNPDYDSRAIEAANATEGLVLTYDSELFLSEYDSFYTSGDYKCDSSGCSVTYTKLPNSEKHTVTIPSSRSGQVAGGHGRGMSQVASYALADQGYKFDNILEYFYSTGVQINSLAGSGGYTSGNSASSASGGFVVRTNMPNRNNSNDKKYWFSKENISYAAGYEGQCTWYAYGRANEILDQAGSDLNWSYAPHAKDWLQYNINSGSSAFSYSTDVTEPKEGAIIVWNSGSFGHVAIVEKVNDDGTIDYSEANIHAVKSSSNPHGFRYQSHISYTGTGVGTISSIWSGYSFVGYIYMIE